MRVVTIGRSSNNDIKLDDPYVGRNHCQIVQHDDATYTIVDLNSSNGTFVSGRRVFGETQLQTYDTVKLGHTYIQWQQYFNIPSQPPIPKPKSKSNALPIILGSVGGVLLLIVIALFIGLFVSRGRSTTPPLGGGTPSHPYEPKAPTKKEQPQQPQQPRTAPTVHVFEPKTIQVPRGVTYEEALMRIDPQWRSLRSQYGDCVGGAKLIMEMSADVAGDNRSRDNTGDRRMSLRPLNVLKMHPDTTPEFLYNVITGNGVAATSCTIDRTPSYLDDHFIVSISLKNNRNKSGGVVIPQGTMIEVEGDRVQNVVITERKVITLAPYESKIVSALAYCAAHHRESPVGHRGRITPYVLNAPSSTYNSQQKVWDYLEAPARNKITFYAWGAGADNGHGERSSYGHAFVRIQGSGLWGFGPKESGKFWGGEGNIFDHTRQLQYATDSCSVYVTDIQLRQAQQKLNNLRASVPKYNLGMYDCTSFAMDIADAAEVYYGWRISVQTPEYFMQQLKKHNACTSGFVSGER